LEAIDRRARLLRLLVTAILVLAALFVASRAVVSDIGIYRQYAAGFVLRGTFPREYPPLALVPMLLARGLGQVLHLDYTRAWLLLAAALLYALALAIGRPTVLVALLPLAAPLLGTYDIWPILCLVLSYRLLPRRPGLSWFLLGVAIALKLFPILFIPLWWQTTRRGFGWLLLPLVTFYPPAMASVVHYQFARQAEWESTVSLLSWLFTPTGMVLRHAFGSMEYYAAWSGRLSLVLEGAYAVLFVWIAFLRQELGLMRRMLLLLSLWFLTNKVLSVQYVFWVVCLAYADGQDLYAFGLLAWVTAFLYPWFTVIDQGAMVLFGLPGSLAAALRLAMGMVAVRFVVWLGIVARLLRRPAAAAAQPAVDSSG